MEISEQSFNLDGNSLRINSHVIYTPKLIKGEQGEQGLKGEKGEKGDILTYDKLTPDLRINLKGEPGNKGEQGIPGQKGALGERGSDGLTIIPHITATATIDLSVDLPHVDVVVGGTDLNPVLNFKFKGLRGYDGINGVKGDKGIPAEPYDDTALINRVESLISAEELRIKNLINQLDEEIKEDVKEMVKKAEFWQENLPEGVIGGSSNFGLENVKEYLLQLGIWKTSDGETYTNWNTIKLSIDEIRTEVNLIKETSVDYQSLSSSLYNYISENQSLAGMLSTWSKFLKLSDDDIQILEWMSSGIKSSAGGNSGNESAIVDLFATARNSQLAIDAYSGLSTKVEQIEGNYVSTASLTSYVENTITSSMAGVVTEATLESAISTMYSSIGENLSGVITLSTLDGAVAELFAKNSSTKASISTYVNGEISKIDLNANEVNVVSNNKVVAEIKNNGRCYFNEGRVFIPTVTSGMNGEVDYNATGIIIKEVSDGSETGTKAYFLGNGFNIQDSLGTVYASLASPSNNVKSLELRSYLSSNNNYALNLIFAINCKDSTTNSPRILAHVSNELESAIGGKGTFETNMNLIVRNNINYTGTCSQTSDENAKNIINEINPSIEDIANVRIIDYEFKSDLGNIHSGSIAQDWQNILPNVVSLSIDPEDNIETLGLDYSSTALISSVVAAREIVKLKQENKELKQRLAVLEEKLNNL